MNRPLRIAQVAPPMERVPPQAYGGTERIVVRAGQGARPARARGDDLRQRRFGGSRPAHRDRPGGAPAGSLRRRPGAVLLPDDERRARPAPRSSTSSTATSSGRACSLAQVVADPGRVDVPRPARPAVGRRHASPAPRAGWSPSARTRRRPIPTSPWAGVVHNGLTLDDAPFDRRRGDALCFVGRVAPEKGIIEAIEIAQATGRPLRIAAKVRPDRPGARVLRDGLPARARSRRAVRRVPRRARAGRARRARLRVVRRRSCRARGRSRSGWSRSRRWPAARRSSSRRVGGAAGDHPGRHRRVLRRRCRRSWRSWSSGWATSIGPRSAAPCASGSRRGRMTDGYEAIYRAALGEGDAAEPDAAAAGDRDRRVRERAAPDPAAAGHGGSLGALQGPTSGPKR